MNSRIKQIQAIFSQLKNCQDIILCGSFGTNEPIENLLVGHPKANKFADIWLMCYPESISDPSSLKGNTLDPINNMMLAKMLGSLQLPSLDHYNFQVLSEEENMPEEEKAKNGTKNNEKMGANRVKGARSDRIVYYSKDGFWECLMKEGEPEKTCHLFGNEAMEFFKDLFPSIHYGLVSMIHSPQLTSSRSSCSLM